MKTDLSIIILAAGKGTRMRSSLPKVLHPIGHQSLLEHVIETARALNPKNIVVVYGHGGELVPTTLEHLSVDWVEQKEQLGTGHAVEQALPKISHNDSVLVLYGDVPLTRLATLNNLVSKLDSEHPLTLLTANISDPSGYGRIVRNDNAEIQCIVEQKDANMEQLHIGEINTGILACHGESLTGWIDQLDNKNAQGEFYLTDIVALCVEEGHQVASAQADHEWEILGVNNKMQLASLERQYQQNIALDLMTQGVTLRDPMRIDVRGKLEVDTDVVIDVNTIFEGDVKLASGVQVQANCILKNVTVGANTIVKAFTHMENAIIGKDCSIGPYARIRPETVLLDDVHIGNFVEIKKAHIADHSKINHLSYVGDANVGKNVNIGAGTITCNYDGANKHLTKIGDNVFVGSDSQLVAPVEIEAGATIGAGSTITKTAPAEQLTLSRSKQVSIANWQRPVKKPKQS